MLLLTLSVISIFLTACADTQKEAKTNNAPDVVNSNEILSSSECQNELNNNEVNEWKSDSILKTLPLKTIEKDKLDAKIYDQCVSKLHEVFNEDIKVFNIVAVEYDMNCDNKDDYFVVPFPDNYPGNALPPMYLFLSDSDDYKCVTLPLRSDISITILATKTNDVYDILWDAFGHELKYNGNDEFTGDVSEPTKILFFPYTVNGDTLCIKISVPSMPQGIDYNHFKVKAYLYSADWLDNKVIISNNSEYAEITYDEVPINGEYYFYLKEVNINSLPTMEKLSLEIRFIVQ